MCVTTASVTVKVTAPGGLTCRPAPGQVGVPSSALCLSMDRVRGKLEV